MLGPHPRSAPGGQSPPLATRRSGGLEAAGSSVRLDRPPTSQRVMQTPEPAIRMHMHCPGQSASTLQVSSVLRHFWSTQVSAVQAFWSSQSLLKKHSTHVFVGSSQTSPASQSASLTQSTQRPLLKQTSPPSQSASLKHSMQAPSTQTSSGSQVTFAQGSTELLQKNKALQETLHPAGQVAAVLQEMGVFTQSSPAQRSVVQASWSLQSASPSHAQSSFTIQLAAHTALKQISPAAQSSSPSHTVSHVPLKQTSLGSQVTSAQGSMGSQPVAKIAGTQLRKIRTRSEFTI